MHSEKGSAGKSKVAWILDQQEINIWWEVDHLRSVFVSLSLLALATTRKAMHLPNTKTRTVLKEEQIWEAVRGTGRLRKRDGEAMKD